MYVNAHKVESGDFIRIEMKTNDARALLRELIRSSYLEVGMGALISELSQVLGMKENEVRVAENDD